MMKRKYLRKAGLIVAAIAMLMFISFLLFAVKQTGRDGEVILLNEGWTIGVNETEYENQALDEYKFHATLEKGDRVFLKRYLPEVLEGAYTLYFSISHSAVDVVVDGELIYTYGHNRIENRELVGSGYHFVQLPLDAEGKLVEITYLCDRNKAFSGMPEIELVPTDYVPTYFANRDTVSVFVSIFLSIFGVLAIVIGLIALCYSSAYWRLLLIGVLSFLAGIWAMCNTKAVQIFSMNLTMNTFIEYVVLYCAPIPLCLLVLDIRRDASKWKKTILTGACCGASIFALVATILHISDICHYPDLVSVYHILGLFILLAILVGGMKPISKMDMPERLFNLGLVAFGGSAALDVFRYNLQKYLWPGQKSLSTSVLPMGAFLFVMLLVVSYLVYLYSMITDKKEKEVLTMMAYNDSLTGLHNRAKCEALFAELNNSEADYAIISIDLNGLKVTNDTYGHAQGDMLLTTYASILKETLGRIGILIRMGGDEFVVIVQEENMADIEQALSAIAHMEKDISHQYVFNIEAAYGVARKSECEKGDAEAVYRMADARMYEMKVESKKDI